MLTDGRVIDGLLSTRDHLNKKKLYFETFTVLIKDFQNPQKYLDGFSPVFSPVILMPIDKQVKSTAIFPIFMSMFTSNVQALSSTYLAFLKEIDK